MRKLWTGILGDPTMQLAKLSAIGKIYLIFWSGSDKAAVGIRDFIDQS
jgi:hypothetical protein